MMVYWKTQQLKHMEVGDNFIEVMGMQLASGRDLSKKLLTDVGASMYRQ